MPKYAHGELAWGICAKCGLRFLLRELRLDGYYPNLRVCDSCYDSKHPQERLVPMTDAVALWRPSPEQANATPSVLSFELDGLQVDLTWTPTQTIGPRIESYKVYRSSDEGVTFVELDSQAVEYAFDMAVLTQPASYSDNTVAAGLTYQYRLVALDGYGRGVNSNTVTVAVPE